MRGRRQSISPNPQHAPPEETILTDRRGRDWRVRDFVRTDVGLWQMPLGHRDASHRGFSYLDRRMLYELTGNSRATDRTTLLHQLYGGRRVSARLRLSPAPGPRPASYRDQVQEMYARRRAEDSRADATQCD